MKSLDLRYAEIPLAYYVKCPINNHKEVFINRCLDCRYNKGYLKNIDPPRIVCGYLKEKLYFWKECSKCSIRTKLLKCSKCGKDLLNDAKLKHLIEEYHLT